jgi:hypothetical protein
MHRRVSWTVAASVAAIVLAAAVSVAGARNFNTNVNARFVWSQWQVSVAAGAVSCPVTLESVFHGRTFHKIPAVLIGYINQAQVNEAGCRGGRMRFLTEGLPWHMRYRAFAGSLPRPTSVGIDVIGLAFRLTELPSGLACLYRATEATPARASFTFSGTAQVTGFANELALPLSEGSLFCGEATGSGSAAVSPTSGAGVVSMTLI